MTYAPNDYALVIGIDDYPKWNDGKKSLKGPIRDAEDFHKWLIDPAGGGLLPQNAHLIPSMTKPLAPLQSGIDEAFTKIRDESDGKERRRFYFYFSGHGHSPAGTWRQCLCLPNWSPRDAGAALDVDSYVKSAIGCLKFSEALFFLDCCRVRQVAPIGKTSDLECGDPQSENRHYAILYATDHYKQGYEGGVDEEVRGYFTAAMLEILKKETVELNALVQRLKVEVPKLAKPKDQSVRAVPTDKEIFLGPPGRKPPPAEEIPQVFEDRTIAEVMPGPDGRNRVVAKVIRELVDQTCALTVEVRTNLQWQSPPTEEPAPPAPGEIVLLRGTAIMGRSTGRFIGRLPVGDYEVRIAHGEASEVHQLRLEKDVVVTYDLPRRRSAAPFSNTLGKREEVTNPIVAASRWTSGDREHADGQAIFVSIRPGDGESQQRLDGTLVVYIDRDPRDLRVGNALIPVSHRANVKLVYYDNDGPRVTLHVPVAERWDTQIFIVLGDRGKPSLSTASILMRAAGEGFDPSDALIDSYELALADLVTGGSGPDELTLDALLWGKYRNPLYGLVGAHFLLRTLSRSPSRSPYDLTRLNIVIENLGHLLGRDSPDVVALRLRRAELSDFEEDAIEDANFSLRDSAPLLRPGFEAFVQATAYPHRTFPHVPFDMAIGLDPNSPWTCWREQAPSYDLSGGWHYNPPNEHLNLSLREFSRADAIEAMWRDSGYTVTKELEGDRITLRGERPGPETDMFEQTLRILTVPEWLVEYLRESGQQSQRTGLEPKLPALVRRTGMPADLIGAAKRMVDLLPSERTSESTDHNFLGESEQDGRVA